jgi:hypothetical protein
MQHLRRYDPELWHSPEIGAVPHHRSYLSLAKSAEGGCLVCCDIEDSIVDHDIRNAVKVAVIHADSLTALTVARDEDSPDSIVLISEDIHAACSLD